MDAETTKRLLLGIVFLTLASGCSKNTPTTPDPVLQTETFTGTVNVLGSFKQNFIVAYDQGTSTASITVTGITTVANATPLTTTIGAAFGSLAFDGSCTRAANYTAPAAAINQELVAAGIFTAGPFCVSIFDPATATPPATPALTEPVNVTFVIKHY